jgi:hypothetical protein
MVSHAILWPTFALVLLSFGIWIKTRVEGAMHLYSIQVTPDSIAEDDSPLHFSPPSSANLRSLFEMPVLYFGLVPLLLVTSSVTILQVVLAWFFVVMHVLNSIFSNSSSKKHLESGIAVIAYNMALAAMWVTFFVATLGNSVSTVR